MWATQTPGSTDPTVVISTKVLRLHCKYHVALHFLTAMPAIFAHCLSYHTSIEQGDIFRGD